jgi:hypothetical protein
MGERMPGGDQSLISDIYETAVIPERWLEVLGQISAVGGADGGFIAAVNGRGERSWVATESQQPILSDWYAGGWHLRNTWIERGKQHKRLRFFDETDIFRTRRSRFDSHVPGFPSPTRRRLVCGRHHADPWRRPRLHALRTSLRSWSDGTGCEGKAQSATASSRAQRFPVHEARSAAGSIDGLSLAVP